MGAIAGVISSVLDNFATALSFFSLYPVNETPDLANTYSSLFATNGCYWKVVAYCTALTGNILAVGSMSGIAMLKMERMPVMWYFKKIGPKALLGWAAGLLVMILLAPLFS